MKTHTTRRWYTCTPVAFKGDHTFFCRDSGLFCRSFQELGIESKAIMPLPVQDGDEEDLIRTEYKNLESSEWWKSLEIEGLVLYAWGDAKYKKIAQAVHEAGIYLVLYMDANGFYFPWSRWKEGVKFVWDHEIYMRGKSQGILYFALKMINAHSVKLLEFGRRKHLSYGDIVTFPHPQALESVQVKKWLYGEKIVESLRLLSNPINSHFIYEGREKENVVLAVGRWDDYFYKRPDFLRAVLGLVAQKDSSWRFEIYGRIPSEMEQWHESLPSEARQKVILGGLLPNQQLLGLYNKAKIVLCTSRSEGTHIVSAEGLCCGCSVVSINKPSLDVHKWYVSHESGTLSTADTPESFAEALWAEMQAWEKGARDPFEIASYWQERLWAKNSCRLILKEQEKSKV